MADRKPLRERARDTTRHLFGGGRFTCSCSPGKEFRGHRAMNAHHMARHGGYWAGDKARKTGRKIGRQADAMRKHARGFREAYGHIDRYGRLTAKARSRPELRGRVTRGQLRQAHRHDRDHEKAAARDRKADRARARGRHGRAVKHQYRADYLRSIHGTPSRETQERQARERAERAKQARERAARTPAPARANGTRPARPAPARPAPSPLGRLAPGSRTDRNGRDNSNGSRKAPERTRAR